MINERVACDVCGAAAGERCRRIHPHCGCPLCVLADQLTAEGLRARAGVRWALHCAGGDREIAGWYPELNGSDLLEAVRRERETMRHEMAGRLL